MTPARRTSDEHQSYCVLHGRHDSCMGVMNTPTMATTTTDHSPVSGGSGSGGGGRSGGRYTPSVAGSTTSARTLLPTGSGRTSASPSPPSTVSRSFLSQFLVVPWQRRPSSALYSPTSSTATLIPHHQHQKQQQQQQQQQQQPSSNAQMETQDQPSRNISPTGKVYMKRPKTKKFGGSGGKAAGGGGPSSSSSNSKGDGTRRALFSNERTFLHWIRFGILLGSLSLTLLNFGERDTLSYYVGTALLCTAMLALAYAASTFHYRDRLLTHKLSAQMLQMQLRKQISSEPGALTAARIADVAKKHGNGNGDGTAGPVTVINVEPRSGSSAAAALQAQIDNLKHKATTGVFYDRVGPTLLGGALIIAYGFNFYLSVVSPPKNMLTHATGTSIFGQV
ncbi:hypothetical protein DFQ27_005439 [Actinomortierella ambigua]|uniref:DUF202 domain-containing protein n=1 Tax=Actinomortierella ambigua TaxID=1343610 RepID=A0A9P6U1U4_9FUNG|nr:hypothetical protein DFQ27_005439 [Actinomortierella ambigua]